MKVKYSNLLYFLLTWNDFISDLTDKRLYKKAMADATSSVRYRTDLRDARKEYLEYLKEKDND